MLSSTFFSVFHFLRKIYSISTTIILNRVIIFYNPLYIFWRWHFWFSEINVTGSWGLWTADQLYLRCFAFKRRSLLECSNKKCTLIYKRQCQMMGTSVSKKKTTSAHEEFLIWWIYTNRPVLFAIRDHGRSPETQIWEEVETVSV